MPLFASGNDAKLIASISRELIHKYISIEVEVYKLSLEDTKMNLYNESPLKSYYHPIRFFSSILKEDFTANDVDTGIDFTQLVTFSFLRDDLVCKNLVLEEGDIIKFDERYYEIDNCHTAQYWAGRNQQTFPISTEGRDRQFGYNVSIKAQTHLTRLSNLHLIDVRSGIN